MKRIIMKLTVALVVVAMMVAMAMPAFAQPGPEGGNPSCGALFAMQQEGRTVGANNLKPLPLGGQTSDVLPGNSEAGLEAAPQGVVFTSPGSPFSLVNPQTC
jgi:hypothetical protein